MLGGWRGGSDIPCEAYIITNDGRKTFKINMGTMLIIALVHRTTCTKECYMMVKDEKW